MSVSPLTPRSAAAALLFSLAASTACDDNTEPSDSIAGTYQAAELTITDATGSTDLLAAGAELTIVLSAAGTTTGTFVVPAAYSEEGVDETLSLAGSYEYDPASETATFEHEADTFIRDVTWELEDGDLHGVFSSGGATLTATLERTS
jgi:hypothetical protein